MLNNFDDLTLVTELSCENGKTYFLYSDGNLYEKSEDGNHRKLDRLNEENKVIIKRIMERLRPAQTDVINRSLHKGKMRNSDEDTTTIEVDAPEL